MRKKRTVEGRTRSAVVVLLCVLAICVEMGLRSVGTSEGWKAASKQSAAAPAKGDPSRNYTETAGGVNLQMVWIPGGTFEMGSRMSGEDVIKKYGGEARDEMLFADEHPVHTVELDGFWMGKFEVTNAQFREFRPSHPGGQFHSLTLGGDSQPVVLVSWNDAKAFCGWLSKESGRAYALPTEAQWEYACRAGTTTERYWGDDDASMGRYANTADRTAKEKFTDWTYVAMTRDGYAVTAPVGRFLPNAFGLHDMIGNVWEWCADWYGAKYYESSPTRNPTGPLNGDARVVRGGGWGIVPRLCRSASRYSFPPELRDDRLGFRVGRTQ